MPLLEILLQHKEFFLIIILLIILALGGMYIKILHTENSELKTDNTTLSANLAASNDSIKTLQGTVSDQNIAIEKMKTAADERAKANAALITTASKTADTFRQHALDIVHLLPQGVDKCKDANDIFNSEIQKNVKK